MFRYFYGAHGSLEDARLLADSAQYDKRSLARISDTRIANQPLGSHVMVWTNGTSSQSAKYHMISQNRWRAVFACIHWQRCWLALKYCRVEGEACGLAFHGAGVITPQLFHEALIVVPNLAVIGICKLRPEGNM